jgi:hypothetical protein
MYENKSLYCISGSAMDMSDLHVTDVDQYPDLRCFVFLNPFCLFCYGAFMRSDSCCVHTVG